MNDADRSIIATLAYYGSFGWPLTLIEIYERLIVAQRLGGRNAELSMGMIGERLERLQVMNMIAQEYGLYALADAEKGFGNRRIEQEKIWAQKLAAYASQGTMASSGPVCAWHLCEWIIGTGEYVCKKRLGYIDYCPIASIVYDTDRVTRYCMAIGRITSQTRVGSIRQILFQPLPHDYSSECGPSLFVYGTRVGSFRSLIPRDTWCDCGKLTRGSGDYRPLPTGAHYIRRSIRSSSLLQAIARAQEWMLSGKVGDWIEGYLKRWQQRRIFQEPATYQPGGRVIATDHEIEFHPQSFEVAALARYNQTLERVGLGIHREFDSGLTR